MSFSFEMVVYLLGLATAAGAILTRIAALERKVDKHNGVIERTYKLEQWKEEVGARIERLEGCVR